MTFVKTADNIRTLIEKSTVLRTYSTNRQKRNPHTSRDMYRISSHLASIQTIPSMFSIRVVAHRSVCSLPHHITHGLFPASSIYAFAYLLFLVPSRK